LDEGKEVLRLRFEAETDIVLVPHPEHWQEYAEWLEELALKELNAELVKENNVLQKKIAAAMDALEKGVRQ
jgi:hypothetical protein